MGDQCEARVILVLRDSGGKYSVKDEDFIGKDALGRALAVAQVYINSWVIRDKMKFVSLNITSATPPS